MPEEIDFSDPSAVEKAFGVMKASVDDIKKDAEQDKEKYDAIIKAMSENPEIKKEIAKAMDEDEKLKNAIEKDEDLKAIITKAQEDDKTKDGEDDKDKEKDAKVKAQEEEERKEAKAALEDTKETMRANLLGNYKALGASEEQIKIYTKSLKAKSYSDLKTDILLSEPQKAVIAAMNGNVYQTEHTISNSLPKNIPFNAVGQTISSSSAMSGSIILEDELKEDIYL